MSRLYTEENIARFLRAVSIGATFEHACGAGGFSYRRYREWMQDAEANPETSPYRELPEKVERARGEGAVRNLMLIQQAAPADWRAAAWMLERCHVQNYGRQKVDLQHSGEVEARIEANTELTDILARLREQADE
jgi:hypothetical protein